MPTIFIVWLVSLRTALACIYNAFHCFLTQSPPGRTALHSFVACPAAPRTMLGEERTPTINWWERAPDSIVLSASAYFLWQWCKLASLLQVLSVRFSLSLRELNSVSWPIALWNSYSIVVETRWNFQPLLLWVKKGVIDIALASTEIFQDICKGVRQIDTLGVIP